MQKGLSHGTVGLLRSIWYPVDGHFEHLYPEREVRDFHNGYRYLDLAFPPGNVKGDMDTRRFKDLFRRQSLLPLDADTRLNGLEAATVRYARRLLRPFTPKELAVHLRVTDRYARLLLHRLVERQYLQVTGGIMRFRTYQLNVGQSLRN